MGVEQVQSVKQVLREFILDSINIRNLGDDDDLFESGIVNSLFAVQWMTFIEKKFKIEIGTMSLLALFIGWIGGGRVVLRHFWARARERAERAHARA